MLRGKDIACICVYVRGGEGERYMVDGCGIANEPRTDCYLYNCKRRPFAPINFSPLIYAALSLSL